ncbi:hypothetical protein [Motiliproteus sp. SC1-56]|uniref:hypothetical protein n=1 Tax=Motiliproteus sp. SC1-56 TaxID=2799565 RepID=UPI001A8E5F15|nr:hypothetical protein [Motiliproteus sp. SC1-56]
MPLIKESNHKDEECLYTGGQCHSFAIALHRITGLSLATITRKHVVPNKDRLFDDEHNSYEYEHAHAVVLLSPNLYADVYGVHRFDPEEAKTWFGSVKPSDPLPSIEPFGDDEELLASFFEDYDEDQIAHALIDAKEWGVVDLLERMVKRMAHALDHQNCSHSL